MRTEEAVTAQRTVSGSAAIRPCRHQSAVYPSAKRDGAKQHPAKEPRATRRGGSAATRPPTLQTDCFFAGCVSIGRVSARRERRRVPVYATERVTQLRREICRAPAKKAEARVCRAPAKKWSQLPGSNRRPADYKSTALPTELSWPLNGYLLTILPKTNIANFNRKILRLSGQKIPA